MDDDIAHSPPNVANDGPGAGAATPESSCLKPQHLGGNVVRFTDLGLNSPLPRCGVLGSAC
jgi:hypothetical protein